MLRADHLEYLLEEVATSQNTTPIMFYLLSMVEGPYPCQDKHFLFVLYSIPASHFRDPNLPNIPCPHLSSTSLHNSFFSAHNHYSVFHLYNFVMLRSYMSRIIQYVKFWDWLFFFLILLKVIPLWSIQVIVYSNNFSLIAVITFCYIVAEEFYI